MAEKKSATVLENRRHLFFLNPLFFQKQQKLLKENVHFFSKNSNYKKKKNFIVSFSKKTAEFFFCGFWKTVEKNCVVLGKTVVKILIFLVFFQKNIVFRSHLHHRKKVTSF